jgi:hypothetical protein
MRRGGQESPVIRLIGRRFSFHPFVLFVGYALIGALK